MLSAITATSTAVSGQAEKGAQMLQGDRKVLGTVEEVKSDEVKLNTGEVEPRYIPLKRVRERGVTDLKKGDHLVLTVNDQNLIVDVHPADQQGHAAEGHHRVVKGQVAEPLTIGHDRAVIRTEDGKEAAYDVRSQVRSKVASIPVGADAVFLIDETNKIADATFSDKQAAARAGDMPDKKSPLKGAQRRIEGTVVEPLSKDRITVKTSDGKEHPYEVWPLVKDKLSSLAKGDSVVLLLDHENKVLDVAIPSTRKGG
jgi:translation initiation factor IF-1